MFDKKENDISGAINDIKKIGVAPVGYEAINKITNTDHKKIMDIFLK
jgi:hypothetical protein